MKQVVIILILSIVQMSCFAQQDEVRGVWVAAPEHNELMNSLANIDEGLDQLAKQGVNMLYLCMYANEKFGWKTPLAMVHGDYSTVEDSYFYKGFSYQNNQDPVAYLIRQAHEREMKVLFWFEYGFMAKWGEAPNAQNSHFYAKNPQWHSRNSKGEFAVHNKTDFYYNAFHPSMQKFLLELVRDAMNSYPQVDGAQADDRMPAMPIDSGYDAYTLGEFEKAFSDKGLTEDYQNPIWTQWRIDRLNAFALRFRETVKSFGKDKIVSFSPTEFPWSKNNLMQDWPYWLDRGWADLFNVQLYHTQSFEAYKEEFDRNTALVTKHMTRGVYSPGILLGLGSHQVLDQQILGQIIDYHRENDLNSESFFYQKWMSSFEIKPRKPPE